VTSLEQQAEAMLGEVEKQRRDESAGTWPPQVESEAADPRSDYANALRLARYHGDKLLFVPGIGWHVWKDPWCADDLAARSIAACLGRDIAGEAAALNVQASATDDAHARERLLKAAADLPGWARQSEMASRIDAALGLAAPMLSAKAERLDADPYLLGCPNGVLDLRTGNLRQHRRDDFITKVVGTDYIRNAQVLAWSAFLNRIFRSSPEMIPYLQRLVGYWLTGLTDPALLAVFYGLGANGKTTLVSVVRSVLGDYGGAAPPSFLIARNGESHPTELAMLQGLRWVVASESGEGGRLDEERVKAITGGDTIAARRMRQDFYEFSPTHKAALQTNHKPIIKGMDEGIWRRIALIPFAETIPECERDPHLTEKLKAEMPGVLAWAAAGCREFLEHGLQPPEVVKAATAEYRSDSDVLGAFITEACHSDPASTSPIGTLYAAYQAWCVESGDRPMTKKTMGSRLEERGFEPHRGTAGVRRYRGIAVKSDASDASDRFSGSRYENANK
jgi:putative DNA primase/helicase